MYQKKQNCDVVQGVLYRAPPVHSTRLCLFMFYLFSLSYSFGQVAKGDHPRLEQSKLASSYEVETKSYYLIPKSIQHDKLTVYDRTKIKNNFWVIGVKEYGLKEGKFKVIENKHNANKPDWIMQPTKRVISNKGRVWTYAQDGKVKRHDLPAKNFEPAKLTFYERMLVKSMNKFIPITSKRMIQDLEADYAFEIKENGVYEVLIGNSKISWNVKDLWKLTRIFDKNGILIYQSMEQFSKNKKGHLIPVKTISRHADFATNLTTPMYRVEEETYKDYKTFKAFENESGNPSSGISRSNTKVKVEAGRDRLFIDGLGQNLEAATFDIVDTFGKLVLRQDARSISDHFVLDIQPVKSGIYFLVIQTDSSRIQRKFYKQ